MLIAIAYACIGAAWTTSALAYCRRNAAYGDQRAESFLYLWHSRPWQVIAWNVLGWPISMALSLTAKWRG